MQYYKTFHVRDMSLNFTLSFSERSSYYFYSQEIENIYVFTHLKFT